ncbi:unnamed protein product [Leptidea sinapis]|uniref:Uncharacterized protein n=1 Tax=Leptidea sinapis TaxID=189913 RepID=A0A5E4PMD6_9NEOP|nr:unnamed protein product [Leptidea sinapis]
MQSVVVGPCYLCLNHQKLCRCGKFVTGEINSPLKQIIEKIISRLFSKKPPFCRNKKNKDGKILSCCIRKRVRMLRWKLKRHSEIKT